MNLNVNDLDHRLLVRLANTLAGRPALWPVRDATGADSRAISLAAEHGALALIDYRLRSERDTCNWPRSVLTVAERAAKGQLMLDVLIERHLITALNHLEAADVDHCLLKGVPLAWSLYPQSWTRPRQDTDLLVPLDQRMRLHHVLLDLGYSEVEVISGASIFAQTSYRLEMIPGAIHEIDVHFKLTNSHAVNRTLDPKSFFASSEALPVLGACARRPDNVHSFLHAAIHRVAHHENSRRLIWLYDMQLLADAMNETERASLITTARDNEFISVLYDSLERTDTWFGSEAISDLIQRTAGHRLAARKERTHAMSVKGASRLRVFITDLKALPGIALKLNFIKENLFPPASWLRKHFGRSSTELLIWPFLRRLSSGLRSI